MNHGLSLILFTLYRIKLHFLHQNYIKNKVKWQQINVYSYKPFTWWKNSYITYQTALQCLREKKITIIEHSATKCWGNCPHLTNWDIFFHLSWTCRLARVSLKYLPAHFILMNISRRFHKVQKLLFHAKYHAIFHTFFFHPAIFCFLFSGKVGIPTNWKHLNTLSTFVLECREAPSLSLAPPRFFRSEKHFELNLNCSYKWFFHSASKSNSKDNGEWCKK